VVSVLVQDHGEYIEIFGGERWIDSGDVTGCGIVGDVDIISHFELQETFLKVGELGKRYGISHADSAACALLLPCVVGERESCLWVATLDINDVLANDLGCLVRVPIPESGLGLTYGVLRSEITCVVGNVGERMNALVHKVKSIV
jgi:hypothetical protein